jgi:hypothetical protein
MKVTVKNTVAVVAGALTIILLMPLTQFFGMMLAIKVATVLGLI